MSTPLKALIQERLRAKMVCRRTDNDLDNSYECDSERSLRQPMDGNAYDITSRGDEDNRMRITGFRGSTTSRRSCAPQTNYPVRHHTHVDPSAYVTPSHKDDRRYPPSPSYGPNRADHPRHRYPRYPREQYHDANVYDHQQHHQRDHRQRQNSHHRVRELPPRHEHPTRHINRQLSQNRASVSPWYRSEHGSPPSKTGAISRSPFRAESSPTNSSSVRAHRKQHYDYIDQDNSNRHRHDINSTPRIATSSSSSHQIRHQEYYQRQDYSWKSRDQDYCTQSAHEAREPSTRHRDHHDDQTPDKPLRCSSESHKHPIQTESASPGGCRSTVLPPRKPQPEEATPPDVTKEPGRHATPQIDMKIIDPPAKTIGRSRVWEDIMSPESRLAAKAFVEKRQRRSEKSTPRTMATQRWLEVIDARASRYKAGV